MPAIERISKKQVRIRSKKEPFTIAIIGGPDELEVQRLKKCFEKLGNRPLIIDTSSFPRQHDLTFCDDSWRYDHHEILSIKAFFLRSLHCDEIAGDNAHTLERHIDALREKDSMLGSMLRWAALQGKLILNPIDTLVCHYYKLDSLQRLRNANIPVPATLGTNDPKAIRHFARKYKQLIYRPLSGGAGAIALGTDDLSPQLLAHLENVPLMLQERIYGSDIRAYVLGDQVIAAAASSISDQDDFRKGQENFQPTIITDAEAKDLINAAKILSLYFAEIDFKRAQDGRHFVLDINPAPLFASFEAITGLEIASHIAKYFIRDYANHTSIR